jgi:hypothetical protein
MVGVEIIKALVPTIANIKKVQVVGVVDID